jgi:hypothetical protein
VWHKEISCDSINAIHKDVINQVGLVAVCGIFHNSLLLLSDICYQGGTCAVLHPTVMYTAILTTGTTCPWSCSFFLWSFISTLRQECCYLTFISFRIKIFVLFFGLLWVSLCCKEHNLCTDTFNFHQEWETCQCYLVTRGFEWISHTWETVIILSFIKM